MKRRSPAPNIQRATFGRLVLIASALAAGTGWLLKDGAAPPSHAIVEAPPERPPIAELPRHRISNRTVLVRSSPNGEAAILGTIRPGEPFDVFGQVDGTDCGEPGWARSEGGGFACLSDTRSTEEASIRLPRLIRFVHPDPQEWNRYISTMTYDTNPDDGIDALVPFIYAKRWRKWKGPNFASASAFLAGDPPIRKLGTGRKYHFVDAVETEKGAVLVREGGAVVPADKVHVYPLTKFHGWDLSAEPIPPGHLPAWAIDYDGTAVHTQPGTQSPVAKRLAYHTPILVEDEPIDRSGHWWIMPNGLGAGIPGYVNDQTGIRHWVPSTKAAGLGAGDLWVDVDLDQQVLALRRGENIEFVTLVSTGAPGTGTPRGIYSIMDKSIWSDMSSRPDSDDPYYVEKVPWVIHFKKRYAIHGTFWHWGFGHTASHGCINLSVRDARYVFDRVSPTAYGGWHSALASHQNPGTILRIRRGQSPVPDRRSR